MAPVKRHAYKADFKLKAISHVLFNAPYNPVHLMYENRPVY